MIRTVSLALLLSAVAAAHAADAPPTMPVELGTRFSGPFEVSFKPFADAKRLDKEGLNEVVRFQREDKKWVLECDRLELPSEVKLRDWVDAKGVAQAGYLSAALNQLRSGDPTADVLRTDVLDSGDQKMGVIIAQTTVKRQPTLLQEVLVQASPRLFYSIAMTCPAPSAKVEQTPEMVEAADTFKAIIDSIQSVDLSHIREDQENRLFRSRALFVDWTGPKLLAVLKSEQYLRFKQDGKDVGYAYVVEQPADALPIEKSANIQTDPSQATGVRVGLRTRSLGVDGKRVDTENWMFVTFDRKHEVWSNITVVNDPNAKTDKLKTVWFSQVGASDVQRERVFDRDLKSDDYGKMDAANAKSGDKSPLPYHEVDKYMLTVRDEGRSAVAQPLQRQLPPFYLPQAIAALLPRLVPLNHPTGYMFASYVGDTRQVMLRYIDVGNERDVQLDGKTVRAIPVTDRIGYDGSPTTHYLRPDGVYLGSVNETTKMEISPTDHDTLAKIWADANLTQPGAVKDNSDQK